MGLGKLSHEIDVGLIADAQEHNRKIAGDSVAPQAGLSSPVAGYEAAPGTAVRVGIKDGARKPPIELCIGLCGTELPYDHLAVRPREIEHAVHHPPVLIFVDQGHRGLAGIRHTGDEVDPDRLIGFHGNDLANRDDRIEDCTFAIRQLRHVHCCRVCQSAAAPDELAAIGLVGGLPERRSVNHRQVEHPRRVFRAQARAARAENRLARTHDFRLDEQLAEGRMGRIGRRRRQDNLGVAGQVNHAPLMPPVRNVDAAQLDVIFRRDGDFGVRCHVIVATAELHSGLGENGFVRLASLERGLVRSGPQLSAIQVAEVREGPPAITRRVFMPACNGEVLPSAVATAGGTHHDVVPAVGQEMGFRRGDLGIGDDAEGLFDSRGSQSRSRRLAIVREERGRIRNAFLQQQFGGPKQRVGQETTLHGAIEQDMSHRQKAHPLVVGHERAHDRAALTGWHARRGEIDRFIKAVGTEQPVSCQTPQVGTRPLRRNHQRHDAGIRRDDQIIRQSSLEPESWYAECAVLIDEVSIGGVVSRLGDSPGDSSLPAVLDLTLDNGTVRAIQQGMLKGGHDQDRHEVFKH